MSPPSDDLLEPGKQVNDWVTVTPDKNWVEQNARGSVAPPAAGKHTIRIAYPLNGEKTAPAGERPGGNRGQRKKVEW